jgi:UDP:flavonoid glycosyltransferase YjiC (YdhE family)
VISSGIPWVRIMSCNPAEMKDHHVPPPFSGLPADDRTDWDEFWVAYGEALGDIHAGFSDYCQARGAPALRSYDFIHESPWLNLYLYPEPVDYPRARPLGPHWHNLGACVRSTDEPWLLPDELDGHGDPLVYLSLGSLGSADIELMRALVAELAGAPYRVIVSKGPQDDEFELAANMAGAEFLPQTSILPQVDLVITHGGNNTITECLYFGKPMVVLPIFWDQHDNAQRIDETGFGARVDTYWHGDGELVEACTSLLGEGPLGQRLEGVSSALQGAPGTEDAASRIENLLAE